MPRNESALSLSLSLCLSLSLSSDTGYMKTSKLMSIRLSVISSKSLTRHTSLSTCPIKFSPPPSGYCHPPRRRKTFSKTSAVFVSSLKSPVCEFRLSFFFIYLKIQPFSSAAKGVDYRRQAQSADTTTKPGWTAQSADTTRTEGRESVL